jgi:apolipoprotein N-acyltransferase
VDTALAALAGALLAVSFPGFGHPAVAWVATAPYFLAIARARHAPPRAFWPGLLTGFVYFTGTLYWTVDTMVTYGGLARAAAVPVAALLVAYLALYPALAAVVIAQGIRRWGPGALAAAPCVWVASEIGRGQLFGGFPWLLLGYSQATATPVAQVASLGGVYALSWLVTAAGASLAYVAIAGVRRAAPVVVMALLGAGVLAGWGHARVARGDLLRAGEAVRVGLVQGNVAQDQKWDPAHGSEILHRYIQLTHDVAARGATFVIWPESATPFFFGEEPAGTAAIRELVRTTQTTLLLGSDQVEPGSPPRYYNAAFLVGPDGATAGVYRKVNLVPFGEYVPLRRVFFFAAPLVQAVGDFDAGTEVTMLPVGSRRASTAICYEVVFPHLARQAVRSGSQMLTTITNDAWFGRSTAPHQHFAQASLRAVEQGRFLVRAANTGISGIVDPYGRVTLRTDLFEEAAVAGDARFLDVRTVYATIGDSFAWACVAVTAWLVVAGTGRPRWRHPPGSR